MQRIDSGNATANKFGAGKAGYDDHTTRPDLFPTPATGTNTTDAWLNGIQEEIANVVESALPGARATATLTLTGPATAAGTILLTIGAATVSIPVANGLSATSIATAIAAAVNAAGATPAWMAQSPQPPATATSAAAVVTLTSTTASVQGNATGVSWTGLPAGVTVTGSTSNLAGGRGLDRTSNAQLLASIELLLMSGPAASQFWPCGYYPNATTGAGFISSPLDHTSGSGAGIITQVDTSAPPHSVSALVTTLGAPGTALLTITVDGVAYTAQPTGGRWYDPGGSTIALDFSGASFGLGDTYSLAPQTTTFFGALWDVAAAQFLVCGQSTATAGTILHSSDGQNWKNGTGLGGLTHAFNGVAVTPNAFAAVRAVAVGDSGIIYSSPDGIAWTSRTSGVGSTVLSSVAFGNGSWIAVGDTGSILTSADGITWTAQTSGVTTHLRGVTWAPGPALWSVVGDGGTILTSANGTAWTAVASSGAALNSVSWFDSDSALVACGAAGTMLASLDGVNWTAQTTGTTNSLYGIAQDRRGAYLVPAGAGGAVLASFDGSAWRTNLTCNPGTLRAAAFGWIPATAGPPAIPLHGPRCWVVVGDNGTLLRGLRT